MLQLINKSRKVAATKSRKVAATKSRKVAATKSRKVAATKSSKTNLHTKNSQAATMPQLAAAAKPHACCLFAAIHCEKPFISIRVSNVCTKANRILRFLRRTLFSCTEEVKEAAYKGMVRPILEYGSSVWDPHYDGLNGELEKVQKHAARFVTTCTLLTPSFRNRLFANYHNTHLQI